MKTSITGALAFLLFAGVSTAALAQEHDHDRDRGGQPQGHQGGPPQAPPAGAARAPAMGAGGHPGAPGGAAPQIERGGDRFGHQGGPRGERFAPGGVPGAAPDGARRAEGARRPDGERRFQGGGPDGQGPPAGERHWDRGQAPHEVVPPGRADHGERDHGWNGGDHGRDHGDRDHGDRDHGDHDHGWNGGDRDRDHRWNGSGSPHWNHGEHWERGRMPPVFWSQHRYHLGGYRAPYGFYARDWAFGDFLPRGWFGEGYWIGDFLDYDLPYPPPGYEWVRVGDDAIMIDRFTGRIVQVVRGIFW